MYFFHSIFASKLLSNVSAMLSAADWWTVWEPRCVAELCRYYHEARDAQRSYADNYCEALMPLYGDYVILWRDVAWSSSWFNMFSAFDILYCLL